MQPTLCSKCKKNIAVVFISKMNGDEIINEGLCMKCAKELGLPQVDQMMKQMGMTGKGKKKMRVPMNLMKQMGNMGGFGGPGFPM